MIYRDAVKCARQIADHPSITTRPNPHNGDVISEKSIQAVISGMKSVPILCYQLRDPFQTHGLNLGNEKIFKVFISEGQSNCWKRFTLVKEMLHLFFPSGVRTPMHRLLADARASRFPNGGGEEISMELAALVAAMELLLPWKKRQEIGDRYYNDGQTYNQIAHELLIPWEIVEQFYSKDYNYAYTSWQANMALDHGEPPPLAY